MYTPYTEALSPASTKPTDWGPQFPHTSSFLQDDSIIKHEKPEGVIVQLGGQTALKLAEKLTKYGVKILGTSFESLDLAEDRGLFSNLLKENNIPYPEFDIATTADEAAAIADVLDFPILVRPSYVLGGQGMKIVINKEELLEPLNRAALKIAKIKPANIPIKVKRKNLVTRKGERRKIP